MITVDTGRAGSWQIGEPFAEAFPPHLVSRYQDFLQLPGNDLKLEDHRIIRQISAHSAAGGEAAETFVLKYYPYSRLRRLRSWYRISPAHREYNSLVFCQAHGVPAIEPVGFGVQRSLIHSVKSCFILTVYADGYVTLRDWLRVRKNRSDEEERALQALMREMGHHIRKAHAEHFFFFRLLAKNILVRPNVGGGLDWLVLDQCQARRLRMPALARSGQLRDVGAIIGSVSRYGGTEVADAFYSLYLPDPLGAGEAALRRRAALGVRIYQKQSPLRRLLRIFR